MLLPRPPQAGNPASRNDYCFVRIGYGKGMVKGMYIQDYGKSGNYYGTAQGYRKENGGIQETPFPAISTKPKGIIKAGLLEKG